MKASIKIGCLSDVGRVRSLNEDSALVLVGPKALSGIDALLVVADGMGGHQAGDVASNHVTAALRQRFSSQAKKQDTGPFVDARHYGALLKQALQELNSELYALASSREELRGMGTTVTGALVAGPQLFIGHVGDTRTYLVRGSAIKQLTADHSWVAEQARAGLISPEEARSHPRRNVITRALGNRATIEVDSLEYDLRDGDILVLCSDGLTSFVGDHEILQLATANNNPRAACQALVSLANERGGSDNITVLVARLDKVGGLPKEARAAEAGATITSAAKTTAFKAKTRVLRGNKTTLQAGPAKARETIEVEAKAPTKAARSVGRRRWLRRIAALILVAGLAFLGLYIWALVSGSGPLDFLAALSATMPTA